MQPAQEISHKFNLDGAGCTQQVNKISHIRVIHLFQGSKPTGHASKPLFPACPSPPDRRDARVNRRLPIFISINIAGDHARWMGKKRAGRRVKPAGGRAGQRQRFIRFDLYMAAHLILNAIQPAPTSG